MIKKTSLKIKLKVKIDKKPHIQKKKNNNYFMEQNTEEKERK